MSTVFITGIGTNVGKTIVSAIIKSATNCAYWKPIQAGDLDNSDTQKVKLLSESNGTIFEEKFRLNTPASPHYAAEVDGITIQLSDFKIPKTEENLIIEGAGGLMVPINNAGLLYLDVLEHWNIPTILVSRNYLGSINHTLLSLELLKARKIEVKAIFFVGDKNPASEKAILTRFPIENIYWIEESENVDASFVQKMGKSIDFSF